MSFFGGDCVHDLLFQLISKGLKISEGNYLLGLQSFKGEEAWDWYICIFCQLYQKWTKYFMEIVHELYSNCLFKGLIDEKLH